MSIYASWFVTFVFAFAVFLAGWALQSRERHRKADKSAREATHVHTVQAPTSIMWTGGVRREWESSTVDYGQHVVSSLRR